MKVSIIMPIYNAEEYLEKSLDSIIGQTYKNIELILINDGSTDRSLEILKRYSNRDKRLVLVSIENSGPGFARNKGLDLARGDYISFVDADDWVREDAIETLMTRALKNNYDLVSSNHFRVGEKVEVSKNNYKTGELKDTYKTFKTSSSFGYVWGKLYKRTFIEENKIRFSEERKVFLEDTLFNLKALAYNPKYYVLNEPLYYYNILDDSLSNTREDITPRVVRVLEDYEKFLDEKDLYKENLDLFIALATRTIAWSLFKSMDCQFNFKTIHKRVKHFSNNITIKRLFSTKHSLRKLRELDSLLQVMLYSFIVFSMRFKSEITLSLVFYIFYPLFKTYICKVVKT